MVSWKNRRKPFEFPFLFMFYLILSNGLIFKYLMGYVHGGTAVRTYVYKLKVYVYWG